MNENKALKNASEFNNGTSGDSTPSPDEIGTENGNSARKTNGLDENADDLDRSKIEETGRRKVGAPIGNQNRFVHGFYTKQLKKAKTGKQRSVKRMAEATLHAVLADQGDINGLSTTFQFYVQRFSRRVARLHVMERAVDDILQRNPQAKGAPNVLAKLNGYLQPLEDACLRDAAVIGFRVANGSSSVTEQIRAIEQQQNHEEPGD